MGGDKSEHHNKAAIPPQKTKIRVKLFSKYKKLSTRL